MTVDDDTDGSKVGGLKEKIGRITQFLKELKVLSQVEAEETETAKDRQVFIRRIVQVGAEIQDARDLLSSACKSRLPGRQWKLLFEVDGLEEDEAENGGLGSCLSGFDVDPSVRFFGLDWERVFGRCFSLSLNADILGSMEADLDLVLISKILRDLAAIEADALSHSEAVLQGRLSKSQQKLIFDQQLKFAVAAEAVGGRNRKQATKSRSFRDSSKSSRQIKYRKNKTTNLDKLTGSLSAYTLKCPSSSEDEITSPEAKKNTVVTINGRKSSTGFMQNVASIFKNIR